MKPSSSLMAQATVDGQANFTGKSLISYPTMSDKSNESGLRYSGTPDWSDDVPKFGASLIRDQLMSQQTLR